MQGSIGDDDEMQITFSTPMNEAFVGAGEDWAFREGSNEWGTPSVRLWLSPTVLSLSGFSDLGPTSLPANGYRYEPGASALRDVDGDLVAESNGTYTPF